MALHEVLARAAGSAPDRPALVHDGLTTTFAELADRVRRGAAVVTGLAPPGGRVAAIGPNHPSWVELYHAVPAAGRVLAFLNHRLSGSELAALVRRSGTTAVVGDTAQLVRLHAEGVEVDLVERAEWAARVDAAPSDDPPPVPGDAPAWLLYTSGTTAAPKGATLSHDGILAAVAASAAARPVEPDDVYLFPFPLCHVAGYNVVHRHAHARPVVLIDRFEPEAFVAAVEADGVTSTSLAATMLAALLDHLEHHPADVARLAPLRSIAYGAAPMAPSLLRRAHELLGVDFAQGYGMTELSGNAVFLGPDDHRRGLAGEEHLLRAAGRPAPGVEVRVVDAEADDADLPIGEVGEILVRGPQVMSGYWDDPVATAAALRDGWLHTGDVGRLDDEGYLYVVDRSKDVIITGGENVSSREVEDVLLGAPGVARVAVVGVADPTWGENVCAVVVPRRAEPFDPDDLVATARAHLAGFKVPRHVVVVDDLPVNAAGKVRKADLRGWLADHPERLGPRR